MKFLTLVIIALIAITSAPSIGAAQSNNRAIEQLSDLNRISPLQNPEFERADKVIDRKIIDRKNKVVGNVNDIILNKNGTIASIRTDFDRLRLGNDINLNYRSLRIRTVSNGYSLPMDSDEIADFYPQLLADIETASGDGSSSFSVKNLLGTTIRASDGRRVGKVNNILFGANGGIASAIYVEISHGTQRGDTVAVPFRSVDFDTQRGRLRGTVSPKFADAMLQIASD